MPHPAEESQKHNLSKIRPHSLALQLPILGTSGSMGDHDSEIMDDGGLDRGDAGALGVVAARREGSNATLCSRKSGWRRQRDRFWTGFLALSSARPAGCERKRRAIGAPGASKRFWGVDGGTPMRCAILLVTTRWRPWPIPTQCWFLMRRSF